MSKNNVIDLFLNEIVRMIFNINVIQCQCCVKTFRKEVNGCTNCKSNQFKGYYFSTDVYKGNH